MANNISAKKILLTIPFHTNESAALVCDVLCVDKEFKGSKVKREIKADGNNLNVTFHSSDLKFLRVAVNSFLKNVMLIINTIKQFEKS